MFYNPSNWYWFVGSDTTKAWSSARAVYVSTASDATYKQWVKDGGFPTPIDSEDSLKAVFDAQYPAGWPNGAKRYVPPWQLRERIEAAGKWEIMCGALPLHKLIKLCTLRDGVDPNDPDVRQDLANGGLDPDEILAP